MKYIFMITAIHTKNTNTAILFEFKLIHINNKLKANK